MDEIKTKFLDLINKKNRVVKIPAMGFSDYFIQNVSSLSCESPITSKRATSTTVKENNNNTQVESQINRLPDQEILDSTDEIYFQENIDVGAYEMNKFNDTKLDIDTIQQEIFVLRQQHKVISKKVLQNILEQRSSCDEEFNRINETEKILEDSLCICKNARTYLNYAKKNLTTTSLEILATYKKRETLNDLLKTLNCIKKMKSTDLHLQTLLADGNYSGAIAILIECKNSASQNIQYKCVEALSQKLQDTMLLTELQLDNVLSEMTQNFDTKKYHELQKAYKMLGKTLIAMDQLHINFISTIHSTAFTVLHNCYKQNQNNNNSNDQNVENENKPKMLFETMCENIPSDKYIFCLINLCKSFWGILVSYYQVTLWHQHSNLCGQKLIENDDSTSATLAPNSNTDNKIDNLSALEINGNLDNEYIQQKFKNGQSRIWNDIQSKICVYLSSTKLHILKYEQFIQVLSIVQRLKKVGLEFCNESSNNLIESMKKQSIAFFKRYHSSCLDEICLFLDNEAWMPVNSFTNVIQLQEYHSMKNALKRHQTQKTDTKNIVINNQSLKKNNHNNIDDNASSIHSQDGGSSIYGSCGYFLRFSEKSSPFDGGFDEAMFEEDILAGIVDESSCYFSEESEEERYDNNNNNNNNSSSNNNNNNNNSNNNNSNNNNNNNNDNESTNKSSQQQDVQNNNNNNNNNKNSSASSTRMIIVNNSSLNVLRCIGRYLQMCRLLHSISPEIVNSMTELIDFYIFTVHDIFGNDLPVPGDNLYTNILNKNLNRINQEIIPKVKNWPPSFSMIHTELCNPETMYGLMQRSVGVESCISLYQQFEQLRGYLEHLLSTMDRQPLENYFNEISSYIYDIRKPVFMCCTARIIDLQMILTSMTKVKWDINHVNVEHSNYVDNLNRGIQMFAMRLEEIISIVSISKEAIWDSLAHVLTHTLVEGYANAKKCTAGGRALMQLDFAHFMSILELTSGCKYPVHHQYVDSYIKAYYMPKDLLAEWIVEQKTKKLYSSKQMITLITCTCINDRKTRQKLLTLIDTNNNHHIQTSSSFDAQT